MAALDEACGLPFVMYCTRVTKRDDGSVESYYERVDEKGMDRTSCSQWPSKLTSLRVIRSPLELQAAKNGLGVGPNLIRQCCLRTDVGSEGNITVGTIWLGECALEFQRI